MKRYISLTAMLVVFLAAGGSAKAGQLTIPNSFSSGATASASAVNANFTAVETAVDDNDTRISAIESTGADITGVTAGSGLTGGGTSGSVTLDIGTGLVTGTHIASATVTGGDILDEPGIDYASASLWSKQITATNWARIGTTYVSITAPTSGYVHVIFSGFTYQYQLTATSYGISTSSICSAITAYRNTGNASSANGTTYHGFSIQWVTPVSAGTNTYYPCAYYWGSGTAPYIQSGYMTAVFYSTRY